MENLQAYGEFARVYDMFQDNVDYDQAKANFETAIRERYPDVTEIQWAE